jgi:hypothetical protein
MKNVFKKLTSLVTTLCFTGASILLPTARALADECESSAGCVSVTVNGTPVTYPKLAMTPVASYYSGDSAGFSFSLASGDQKKVSLNTAAQALGMSSSQVAQMVASLPSSSSMVYSRMSPMNGTLDVNIFKVVKQSKVTTLYLSKFTPQMGNRWRVSKTFASQSEKMGGQLGRNPFDQFDAGDQLFHNVPTNSPYVAETISGLAARFAGAPVAILNIAHFNERKWTTVAHHFFTTTTTIHTAGDENPIWMIGLPAAMSADGDVGANYCLDGLSGSTCPVAEHQVFSGMAWADWTGGNLPDGVTTVHEFQEKHTGFNFVTFILTVATVAFGFTGVIAVFVHQNQGQGDTSNNVAAYLNALISAQLEAAGTQTGEGVSSVGSAAVSYVSGSSTSGAGPFTQQNIPVSVPATSPSTAYAPTNSYETYFQGIEGQAMTTSPLGQASSQSDSSGNNGFRAFSNADQGYANSIAPSANVNVQFNSMKYIQDTQ